MARLAPDHELDLATASSQVARAILVGASAYGVDVGALSARFDLSAQALADPDGRIPAPVAIRLWDEVPRLVGDELFGLRLGARASGAGAMPVVGYLVQTSATLGAGLVRALRYQGLVQTLNRASLQVMESTARLAVHVRSRHVERLRHAVDFALAFFVTLAGRLTGAPVVPRGARFAYARPSSLDEHRRLFGADLRFDAPSTELALDPSALERPMLSADVQLHALIERHAQSLLGRLPADDTLVSRVRASVVDGLRADRSTVATVAASLRMSARTLQRRLREHGTSHAEILDEVRRELGLRYVAERSLSLSAVALLLGFAEQSTFHRAFLRWTGRTPGAVRRATEPDLV